MKKEYIAPESNVMEMNAEGVFCGSTFNAVPEGAATNSIQIWEEQDIVW